MEESLVGWRLRSEEGRKDDALQENLNVTLL